jgi:hypothetical protein
MGKALPLLCLWHTQIYIEHLVISHSFPKVSPGCFGIALVNHTIQWTGVSDENLTCWYLHSYQCHGYHTDREAFRCYRTTVSICSNIHTSTPLWMNQYIEHAFWTVKLCWYWNILVAFNLHGTGDCTSTQRRGHRTGTDTHRDMHHKTVSQAKGAQVIALGIDKSSGLTARFLFTWTCSLDSRFTKPALLH